MTAMTSALMVLFAGDNLDGWMTLAGQWAVRDGAMVCQAAPASIRSSFESDQFTLRFEYRRAGRGESRLAVHSKMTTGGPIVLLTSQGLVLPGAPQNQPGLPPDEWIEATVKVAADHLQIGSSDSSAGPPLGRFSMPVTPGSRGFLRFEATEPGIEIRNIRVEEAGFVAMFDGRSLDGWEITRGSNPDRPGWTDEKGIIRCGGAGSGWLRSLRTYDNLIIRLEYQLPPRGNSGIYLRAPIEGRVSRIGLEVQLLDDFPYRGRFRLAQFDGSVYDGIAPEVQVPAPADQWNAIEVLLDRQRIRTTLNAVQLYDARLDDPSRDVNRDKRPLSTRQTVGFIGFQEHSSAVKFRNVRIRELP